MKLLRNVLWTTIGAHFVASGQDHTVSVSKVTLISHLLYGNSPIIKDFDKVQYFTKII